MIHSDLKKLPPRSLPNWFIRQEAMGVLNMLEPFAVSKLGANGIEPGIDTEAIQDRQRTPISKAHKDIEPAIMLSIDFQVGFCYPGASLYVKNAENDCICAAKLLLKYPEAFSALAATLDTHLQYQIFHPSWWVNDRGEHPTPFTEISMNDIRAGKWKANNQHHIKSMQYIEELEKQGLFKLMIWPFHTMLGTVDHALMPVLAKAGFYHGLLRHTQMYLETKGNHPLTEHYSVLGPEVKELGGAPLVGFNTNFFQMLLKYHRIVVNGEAADFCVLRSMQDFLSMIAKTDPTALEKVIILKDCTSPVFPGGEKKLLDLAQQYQGIKLRESTQPIHEILE